MSVAVVAGATALAVVAANHPFAQDTLTSLPLLDTLPQQTWGYEELTLAVTTSVFVVVTAYLPLFRPTRRRVLDTIALAERRLVVAFVALAAIGYFDYTYRLPRTTLLLVGATLSVLLPAWFVSARPRPSGDGERAVIVGDDPEAMAALVETTDLTVVGYVSPPTRFSTDDPRGGVRADGGQTLAASENPLVRLPCLGGVSDLDVVFAEYDIDTALLAFSRPDREQFFATLDQCDRSGVGAKVHSDHADSVLVAGRGGDLVDVDLEPWDWQDRMLKRLFDVAFAAGGLLALSPVILLIALAVRLDSEGPVFYTQERTAEFGGTFTVYKFRSMYEGSEDSTPGERENSVTPVGAVLRRTHLDEIPQLYSILVGDMSVVGPRAAWVDEEVLLEQETPHWRKRWFVKPGLTGLAQTEGISSSDPEEKLQSDVEYIRSQSLWFDTAIVIRQLFDVVTGDDEERTET